MFKLLIITSMLFSLSNAEVIKKYYDTGELKYTVNTINGIPDGITKGYYKNGKLRLQRYLKNGKIVFKNITDYLYKGNSKYTFTSKGKYKASIFKKDNKIYDGKFIMYYPNNEKAEKRYFRGNFLRSNVSAETGELLSKGKIKLIAYFNKGKINGQMKKYERNGDLIYISHYNNGLRSGKVTHFRNKNTPYIIENYKKGKLDGLNEMFLNGPYQLSMARNFKNGLLHGKSENYFKNGGLSTETNFINGLEEGTHIEYWENGLISNKITMVKGKAIAGTWWHENGTIGGAMTNAHFRDFDLDY